MAELFDVILKGVLIFIACVYAATILGFLYFGIREIILDRREKRKNENKA